MTCLGAPLFDVGWPGAVPLRVLLLTLPREGHFLVITNPPMTTGYSRIPPLQIEPLVGGVGAKGATVAIEGVRKRMDF